MSVGIVGLGVVGGTMYRALVAGGTRVIGFDLDATKSRNSIAEVFSCEIVLVAVPTPTSESGTCDLSAVNAVFKQAAEHRTTALLVLRSTVPVGTTDRLNAQYPKLHIGFSPEFLRQATADQDLLSEPLRVFGGNEIDARKYFAVLPHDGKPAEVVMSPAEAELTKLFLNAFAAMKSVFAGEVSILAERFSADWSKVTAAAQIEGRVGAGYLEATGPDGKRGFGGRCLPKDTRMLAKALGKECLLRKVSKINSRLRGTAE